MNKKMNKYLYKTLAAVMIGVNVVSMTGCSGKAESIEGVHTSNQNVSMGRYVENEIKVPEDIAYAIKCIANQEGNITLYGYNQAQKFQVYTSQDGKTWSQSKLPWTDKVGNGLIQDIAQGQDGTVYLSIMNMGEEQNTVSIKKAKADGTIEDVKLQDSIEAVLQMSTLSNGDILVATYDSVTRYSGVDGSRLLEYGGQFGFTVIDNQIAVLDGERGGVVFYDLETGNEERMVPYEGLNMGSKVISDAEGNMYVIDESGINQFVKEDETWKNIVGASSGAFGDPALVLTSVSTGKNGFNVLFQDIEGQTQVFEYAYNPDLPSKAATEIDFYMLEDDSMVRKAVVEYQRQNPDVAIHIQVGLKSGETSVTKADAIRTLNTELLAGKGPDIILLDGLPVDSYIEKGVLLNMNDIIEPMLNNQELLPNIIESYRTNNEIYSVPTRFTVPMMWGDEALLKQASSLEELAEWAKQNPGKPVLYSTSPETLIETFYGVSAAHWMDENGQIKPEAFKTFLEAIDSLADKDAKSDLTPMEQSDAEYYAIEHMAYGDTLLTIQDMGGFSWLNNFYSAISQRKNGTYKPVQMNGKGVFRGKGLIGINKNSENVEIAKEIVKTALGEEVQSTGLFESGFVVNTKAFENQKQESMNLKVLPGYTTPTERPIPPVQAGKEEYEKIEQVLQSVTQPVYEDEILMELIIEETKGYFDGTKTAEETTQAVSQRTKAYLAE